MSLLTKLFPGKSLPGEQKQKVGLVAQKLQSWEARFSNKEKSWALSIIVLAGTVYFICLLVGSLRGDVKVYKIGHQRVITPIPAYTTDQKELKWIIQYNYFLDSLKSDSNGVKIYREMRRERPGLLDTIEMAGKLLQQQK